MDTKKEIIVYVDCFWNGNGLFFFRNNEKQVSKKERL